MLYSVLYGPSQAATGDLEASFTGPAGTLLSAYLDDNGNGFTRHTGASGTTELTGTGTANGVANSTGIYLVNRATQADVSIRWDVTKLGAAASIARVGVVVRHTASANFTGIRAYYDGGLGQFLVADTDASGNITTRITVTRAIAAGETVVARLVGTGSTLTLTIDGVDTSSSAFTTTAVGARGTYLDPNETPSRTAGLHLDRVTADVSGATNATATPAAAVRTRTALAPTVAVGGVTALPAAAVRTRTALPPTIVRANTVTPAPAIRTRTALAPTVVPGGVTSTPLASLRTRVALAATVLAAITASPASAVRTRTALAPTRVIANTALPAAAVRTRTALAPTVTVGGVTASPAAAVRTRTALAPTIVKGGITALPASAVRTRTAVTPTIVTSGAATPAPAIRTRTALSPTIAIGAITVTPLAATRTRTALAPTILRANTALPASAVRSRAAVPPAVTAAISVTPASAVRTRTAVTPSLGAGGGATATPASAVRTRTAVTPTITAARPIDASFTGAAGTLLSAYTDDAGNTFTRHTFFSSTAELTGAGRAQGLSNATSVYTSDYGDVQDPSVRIVVDCLTADSAFVGAVVRANAPTAGTATHIRLAYRGNTQKVQVVDFFGFSETVLADVSAPLSAGGTVTADLVVIGNQASLYIDGAFVNTYTTTITAAGRVGVVIDPNATPSRTAGFQLTQVTSVLAPLTGTPQTATPAAAVRTRVALTPTVVVGGVTASPPAAVRTRTALAPTIVRANTATPLAAVRSRTALTPTVTAARAVTPLAAARSRVALPPAVQGAVTPLAAVRTRVALAPAVAAGGVTTAPLPAVRLRVALTPTVGVSAPPSAIPETPVRVTERVAGVGTAERVVGVVVSERVPDVRTTAQSVRVRVAEYIL